METISLELRNERKLNTRGQKRAATSKCLFSGCFLAASKIVFRSQGLLFFSGFCVKGFCIENLGPNLNHCNQRTPTYTHTHTLKKKNSTWWPLPSEKLAKLICWGFRLIREKKIKNKKHLPNKSNSAVLPARAAAHSARAASRDVHLPSSSSKRTAVNASPQRRTRRSSLGASSGAQRKFLF